jgi:hypothetical protein
MVPILHGQRPVPAIALTKGEPMTAALQSNVCPFCSVPTAVPHESQAGCIEALQVEIARVRKILEHVKDPRFVQRCDESAELR